MPVCPHLDTWVLTRSALSPRRRRSKYWARYHRPLVSSMRRKTRSKRNKAIDKWLWRLTKHYLFWFRHCTQCATCIKRDVCRFHDRYISDIIISGEAKGTLKLMGILWWRCSFYVQGELPDRRLKVERRWQPTKKSNRFATASILKWIMAFVDVALANITTAVRGKAHDNQQSDGTANIPKLRKLRGFLSTRPNGLFDWRFAMWNGKNLWWMSEG